jgi:hypothetical protein
MGTGNPDRVRLKAREIADCLQHPLGLEFALSLIPPDFVVGGMIAYKQVGWFN